MLDPIKKFFYPETTIYIYPLQKEHIVERIQQVLKRKSGFFDENDLYGEFIDRDTFKIGIKQGAYSQGSLGRSILIGKIVELPDGHSQICLKGKPSLDYYVWFFLSIIIGLGFLYQYFHTLQNKFLLQAFAIMIIGPLLCVKISNIAIIAILERYYLYIHKKLKS